MLNFEKLIFFCYSRGIKCAFREENLPFEINFKSILSHNIHQNEINMSVYHCKGKIVLCESLLERGSQSFHLKHTSLLVLYIKTFFFFIFCRVIIIEPWQKREERIVFSKHLNFSIQSTQKAECVLFVYINLKLHCIYMSFYLFVWSASIHLLL